MRDRGAVATAPAAARAGPRHHNRPHQQQQRHKDRGEFDVVLMCALGAQVIVDLLSIQIQRLHLGVSGVERRRFDLRRHAVGGSDVVKRAVATPSHEWCG